MLELHKDEILTNDEIGRLLVDLTRRLEEISNAPGIARIINPTTSSSSGIVMLGNPAAIVSGTTTAVTSWTAVNLAAYIPTNAKAVILNSEIELGSGGGIQTSAKGGTWSNGVQIAMGISGGGVGERSCGSAIVPCTGQSISYKVTDQAGGGTTSAWVSYSISIVGYLV